MDVKLAESVRSDSCFDAKEIDFFSNFDLQEGYRSRILG